MQFLWLELFCYSFDFVIFRFSVHCLYSFRSFPLSAPLSLFVLYSFSIFILLRCRDFRVLCFILFYLFFFFILNLIPITLLSFVDTIYSFFTKIASFSCSFPKVPNAKHWQYHQKCWNYLTESNFIDNINILLYGFCVVKFVSYFIPFGVPSAPSAPKALAQHSPQLRIENLASFYVLQFSFFYTGSI